MHMYIDAMQEVIESGKPSSLLSFDLGHVLKTLQLFQKHIHVSRPILCDELSLGEGSIKTLVKHLKNHGIVTTTNAGTKLTSKGKEISLQLLSTLPAEMAIPKCSVALGRFNYAVLVRQYGFAVKSGVEQRDAAIKVGGVGATTLLYKKNGNFAMPGIKYDTLKEEPHIAESLCKNLKPQYRDVIIIGSSNQSGKLAEHAVKNAAIITIMNHQTGDHLGKPSKLC